MVITCDTELGDLIKESDVTSKFSSLYKDLKAIVTYSEVIKQESISGNGLSVEAFTIGNKSYVNEDALKQLRIFEDFYSIYSNSKSQMIEDAKEQRQKELKQLKAAIEEKISQLKIGISNLEAQARGEFHLSTSIISPYSINSVIADNKAQLKKYKDKLAIVESEVVS